MSPRSEDRARRPVIGITTYVELASWGLWRDAPAALVPHGYVAHVESAGGVALLVPPRVGASAAVVAAVLGSLDGLVIAGGADVDPARYGADRHPSVEPSRADRDSMELALVRGAVARDLPLLGICRGMQVMAIAAGGSLIQHVPDVTGSAAHSPALATFGSTQVSTVDGSLVAGIVGARMEVPCCHHQAVASAPGYVASASASDGVMEAMEAPDARFRMAVQWHPEASTETALMRALILAAVPSRRS
ncbi:MAG TPA: gamma-glutamyl-gamma-aminobutyrate hydrolase family protein [Candidatus Lustribacter sp.]|nr:gamma-glutamyl-gamma-aminobutyrate hydrolase family protein [Candidatus Lustribacter sp.]